MPEKIKCKLCGKNEATRKHHPIPKNVIKAINPESELKNLTIKLCNKCERECHYAFLRFLIDSQMHDGYNRYSAIKYWILKKWLKNCYLKVWKKWQKFYKPIIEESLKEFSEDNL